MIVVLDPGMYFMSFQFLLDQNLVFVSNWQKWQFSFVSKWQKIQFSFVSKWPNKWLIKSAPVPADLRYRWQVPHEPHLAHLPSRVVRYRAPDGGLQHGRGRPCHGWHQCAVHLSDRRTGEMLGCSTDKVETWKLSCFNPRITYFPFQLWKKQSSFTNLHFMNS
jgi:hypothetical protein